MKKPLTLATRPTALALAQSQIVVAAIKKLYPELELRITQVKSEGDRDTRTALWDLRQTGFFTSQLENALLEKKAHLAVHSFKDLPTKDTDGLTIAAVLDRQFPEDCLVAAGPMDSIEQLPPNARVGTSSLRRAVQLKRIREDLQILPLRGSIPTRLEKVRQGKFDAVVAARAGLERLALADRISLIFAPEEFLPAPAQGALAVQIRTDDTAAAQLIATIDDSVAHITALAERRILKKLRCGCRAPVGTYAVISAGQIDIDAFLAEPEGRNFIKRSTAGPVTDAPELADRLAEKLLTLGGRQIIKKLE